jgi:hypothetical protein
MKQTAVEWYFKQMQSKEKFTQEEFDSIYEQANKMQEQQQGYSEEDMKEAYFSAIESTGEGWNGEYAEGNNPNIEEKFKEGFNEWFNKFKNK